MHLLIDGQPLQTSTSRQRGIGRYSSNLLRAIVSARPNWDIEIVQNASLPPIKDADRNGLPVLSFQPPLGAEVEQRQVNERYYADWLTARGSDGVLFLSHCEGWEAVVPTFCGHRPRVFGIAYDLIPLLFPHHYLTDFGTTHWYAHRFRQLLQSDALLAISEATERDVRTLGGHSTPPVVNVGGAVDPLFAPWPPEQLAERTKRIRTRFGLHREFVLYVGAMDYRKNLHGAIRAFAALPAACRSHLDLAVTCRLKPAEQASIRELATETGVAAALRLICSADDDDLRTLYQTCRLFFFPSLYEGLGLPVLEALHCGAPVVTSNNSSLPEYAGPVSWLGDPSSSEAMAEVLQKALAQPRDARRAERLAFARAFTWSATAERACAMMEQSPNRWRSVMRPRRRLGWVMHVNSTAFDEIQHAEKLLPLLDARYDIEVIACEGPLDPPKSLSQRHLILTGQEVAARHAADPYDLFVYPFLTASPRVGSLHVLRKFPGLIVHHGGTDSALDFGQATEINSVVVHHDPSSVGPNRLAAIYADWIEKAMYNQDERDGLWRNFAVQALAEAAREDDEIIDSWTELRDQGQRYALSR